MSIATVRDIIRVMERTINSITRDNPDQAGAIDITIPTQPQETLQFIRQYFIKQGWLVTSTFNHGSNTVTYHLRWWTILNGSKPPLSHFEAHAQAKATLHETGCTSLSNSHVTTLKYDWRLL